MALWLRIIVGSIVALALCIAQVPDELWPCYPPILTVNCPGD